ncbi:hypothetical protein ACQEVF_45225 [Nonomuraea polychroma]|uniref:hypothetical protein n=1 Tax=Nonomuraea polychroma TaxID=46176 RepID=UPI003D8C07E6
MSQATFPTLHVTRDRGVVMVVIDNPPVNVLSLAMMADLMTLLTTLREDETPRLSCSRAPTRSSSSPTST